MIHVSARATRLLTVLSSVIFMLGYFGDLWRFFYINLFFLLSSWYYKTIPWLNVIFQATKLLGSTDDSKEGAVVLQVGGQSFQAENIDKLKPSGNKCLCNTKWVGAVPYYVLCHELENNVNQASRLWMVISQYCWKYQIRCKQKNIVKVARYMYVYQICLAYYLHIIGLS
jgi:hypothetical protein